MSLKVGAIRTCAYAVRRNADVMWKEGRVNKTPAAHGRIGALMGNSGACVCDENRAL